MNDDYGRQDRREARRWFGLGVAGWVAALVVALLLAGGLWALRVGTSGIKGQGDALIEHNSAENWVSAQARFEGLYQEFDSTLVKIANLAPQVAASPDDKTLTTQLNGLRSHCATVAADYNADARSYLSQDFRSADLPDELDATDCNN